MSRNIKNKVIFGRALVLIFLTVAAGDMSLLRADGVAERAHKVHFDSIVMNTHDDITQWILYGKYELGSRHTEAQLDIPRLREGGVNAVFFSIWVPSSVTGPEAVKRALRQIDAVREQIRRHSDALELALTADDVRRIHRAGRIAALMGVEGGHMIDNDLGVLRTFAALGVRYMTLTHGGDTDWADSSTDHPKHNGLTEFGKSVIREMNRLGMLVDVSHVSDKTFYDALAESRAPLIASHSSCRALCNSPRNMTDDMIRKLAAKGGVININFLGAFLDQKAADAVNPKEILAAFSEADEKAGNDDEKRLRGTDQVEIDFGKKLPRVDWKRIVDHIDHAVKLVGIDHVGLGPDFVSGLMAEGLEDNSKMFKITEEMLRRGYSETDIRKVLGENDLRLMVAAELAARGLQDEKSLRP